MARHFRSRNHKNCPPEVTAAERAQAKEVYETNRVQVLQRAEDWTPPTAPMAAVDHVDTFSAYRCRFERCAMGYVKASSAQHRADTSAWRGHQRREHGVVEFDAAGRPAITSALVSRAEHVERGEAAPWGAFVKVQRLFAGRPCHVVLAPGTEIGTQEPDHDVEGGRAWFEQFNRLAAGLQQTETAQLQTIVGPATHEVDAWAREAGFTTRLQGFSYTTARQVCDRPRADEEEGRVAAAVWHLAESALHKSHEITRTTGAYRREVVPRVHPELQPPKPWEAYTSNGAIADHARTMQACLSFFARI
jgi:hypothetical protein